MISFIASQTISQLYHYLQHNKLTVENGHLQQHGQSLSVSRSVFPLRLLSHVTDLSCTHGCMRYIGYVNYAYAEAFLHYTRQMPV